MRKPFVIDPTFLNGVPNFKKISISERRIAITFHTGERRGWVEKTRTMQFDNDGGWDTYRLVGFLHSRGLIDTETSDRLSEKYASL